MISEEEFLKACKEGDTAIVKQYIAEGGDLDARDNNDWTGLIKTAYKGHIEGLRALIAAGADVNTLDRNGKTALIWTAYWGYTDCLRELIAAGANINAQDDYGWTALTWAIGWAIGSHKYEAAELLVGLGADIYAKDNIGKQAIDHCKDENAKDKLIRLSNRHITAAIKSADKPDIIQGFDTER